MKQRTRFLELLAAGITVLALASVSFGRPGASEKAAAPERHPHIRAAINALQAARPDLQNAAHDFCGHRVEALEASDRALDQLKLALESDRASLDTIRDGVVVFEKANWAYPPAGPERHPLIRKALIALQAARGDLQKAAHDFKGHRVEALEATNNAIEQLQRALACDRN